jgi:hypothetical protein
VDLNAGERGNNFEKLIPHALRYYGVTRLAEKGAKREMLRS